MLYRYTWIVSSFKICIWYLGVLCITSILGFYFPLPTYSEYAVTNRYLTLSKTNPFVETSFCNEPIPFYRPNVQLSFNAEYKKFNSNETIRSIKSKANDWFPIFKPIFSNNGLSEDLIYIVLAESQLNNLVSPAGATGFWQFMPSTAKALNLQIDTIIDERLNPVAASYAVCNFLKEAYKRFGSWSLAVASYNFGQEGLEREILRQGTKDFYKLRLNTETKSFIFKIIAFKTLFESITYSSSSNLSIKKIKIDKSATLMEICDKHHLNFENVRLNNPWIKIPYLKARKNEYYIICSKTETKNNKVSKIRKRKRRS
jgi:membrane-bound lytic murein transglycosylase D